MGIGAVSGLSTAIYNPHIYNTNSVSSASLSKVNPISDDLTKSKLDYSGIVQNDEQVNVNPLKPGQTSNFADVLMSQMSMSSARQAELLGNFTQVVANIGNAEEIA